MGPSEERVLARLSRRDRGENPEADLLGPRFVSAFMDRLRKLNGYSDCASLRCPNMQSPNKIPAALQPEHHFSFFSRVKSAGLLVALRSAR